jgi:hypothetical protein
LLRARTAHDKSEEVAALFLERAKRLDLTPPGPEWEAINNLESK